MQINNSTFLITGGSLGIGRATAKLLIEKGGKVAITARNKSRLEKTAKEIGAFPIHADVSKQENVKKTYETFIKEFKKLDCLINNAGIGGKWNDIFDLDLQDFMNVYSVNVFGAALMTKYAADIFKKQKYGNIINISSTAGTKGYANGTVYSSSKFALRGMTQCWQAELRKYNVRVILVNPSEVLTAFGDDEGRERKEVANKLRGVEIAHTIVSTLEMDGRGFIPEVTVWATNPF
ncbi:MAG: SDR family oxidoreductase [Ignavibacteriaceae bacterium]|jgi:3-oxoacyl-[acyl-carrier protein] reductase|nr:SDR family oxidoreductase [Ignavibacteriaceae bacterium]MCW8813700.1 SDR family oxidoreductase [Chlorobium sp.]MCW8816725.1 SDR family oxidoreductase [Ignavibacteriaceae bacterium]MCW8824120.1 SDR family oxidoreductase [Ignavibacteriaceae bacterium]MCW9098553.1 SDR family oxidoreductase [Ignavibacteriaceae bacterium]